MRTSDLILHSLELVFLIGIFVYFRVKLRKERRKVSEVIQAADQEHQKTEKFNMSLEELKKAGLEHE